MSTTLDLFEMLNKVKMQTVIKMLENNFLCGVKSKFKTRPRERFKV